MKNKKASGMKMANPDDSIKIEQWIDSFVDDTSLFSNLLGSTREHKWY
jgi:hypothetical protein